MLHEVTEKEAIGLTVLVRAMHISLAGPRTRRSQTGKHGAGGAEKPRETRSREVAPRRKVGSLDRQVPGGHTSKVRCRSRCGASYSILQLERQAKAKTEDSFEPRSQTGRRRSSLAVLSLLPRRPSADKKLLPKKPPSRNRPTRKPQVAKRVAQFPAQFTYRGAKNPPARWPSA
jgi:hypothetical protein